MITPALDIINNFYYETEEKEFYDDDEMPPMMPQVLRRTHKVICSSCKRISSEYTLEDRRAPIMCFRWIEELKKVCGQVQESIKIKKDIMEKRKDLYQDIIEVGMIPERIKQTDLFETTEFFSSE